MYSGIIQALLPITSLQRRPGLLQYVVHFNDKMLSNLQLGASVSINGVCQTVVAIKGNEVFFDAMSATLKITNMQRLELGTLVNVERSLKFGDEIGGHLLAGHVIGMAKIAAINESTNNYCVKFEIPANLSKYIFNKGFVALDGISLTVSHKHDNSFWVYFIPETLKRTNIKNYKVGDAINLEIDSQTQALVETAERLCLNFINRNTNSTIDSCVE